MIGLQSAQTFTSVCPHDCPSTCSLEVEIIESRTMGRVHGSGRNSYTAGVICAKVARYAERANHPQRLLYPLLRTGPKNSGQFRRIGWEDALDIVAGRFLAAEAQHGPETVWPYYYAGTMGLVMRDGIHRLRHAKRYSGQYNSICTNIAWTGYAAGTGRIAGPDPREMARADCVVIWGTNAVHTQVNVMTHAIRARKERGAKIVAIDIYDNATLQQADLPLIVRPGTDGALACAVMHILFRDGFADRDYLNRYTDHPKELEAHLQSRTPQWAAAITGLRVDEIETFARLVGERKRTFFRLGYGFARQRNGAAAMHAASSIAAVTGAWQHEGGGAFFNNGAIYHWDKTLLCGLDVEDKTVRMIDQSQIGRALTGDAVTLRQGPPVTAMLVQNTNPASVAPEQETVKHGLMRDDLFLCIHEHFMTETARFADIVLPATMFHEHDDIYQSGGNQYLHFGAKLAHAPGECRSNHEVVCALAKRVGAEHRGFAMTPREIADETLRVSGWGHLSELEAVGGFRDVQPDFEEAHYLGGFGHPDGRYHFKADWSCVPNSNDGLMGPWRDMPQFPDHWTAIEETTAEYPFRLATSPARNFLNSTFTETGTSQSREGHPTVLIHPQDAQGKGISDGDWVCLSNVRGDVFLRARLFAGLNRGVLVAESIWPNAAHPFGRGINTLTGADAVAPYGGAAFHDNRVALERKSPEDAA